MTYEKFIAEIESMGHKVPQAKPRSEAFKGVSAGYMMMEPYVGNPRLDKIVLAPTVEYSHDSKDVFKPALMLRWKSSETSGGSCYDDGNSHCTTSPGEPEPNFDALDEVLEHFCPNITYLQYKKLAPIIKVASETDNGYYGDSTTYALKFIDLHALWETLSKIGLLSDEYDYLTHERCADCGECIACNLRPCRHYDTHSLEERPVPPKLPKRLKEKTKK